MRLISSLIAVATASFFGKGDKHAWSGDGSGSIVLDATNYTDFVTSQENTVVLYYVPWCSWCQRFLPVYDQISKAATSALAPLEGGSSSTSGNSPGTDHSLKFAKIDVNEKGARKLQETEHIMGFPTVKLHTKKGAVAEEYEGEHKMPAVLKWLMERTTSDVAVTTPEQLTALLEVHHKDVVVLMVNPTPEMLKAKDILSKKLDEVMFGSAKGKVMVDFILDTFDQKNAASDPSDRPMAAALRSHPTRPFIALLNPHGGRSLEGPSADFDDSAFAYSRTHVDYHAHIFPENESQVKQLGDPRALEQFIRTFQFPTVARWSPAMAAKLVSAGRPFLVAFTDLLNELQDQEDEARILARIIGAGGGEVVVGGEVLNAPPDVDHNDTRLLHMEDVLWDLGSLHRSKLVTMVSGTAQFFERRLLSTLGLEDAPSPSLVFVTMNPTGNGVYSPTLKYVAPKEVAESIFIQESTGVSKHALDNALSRARTWIDRVLQKKILPNTKSEEPLPDDVNKGPLYVVAGTQFDAMVLDSKEDWLVDFYAPWCGHCRVLAPIYNDVARAFKQAGVKTIKLGKIDATANEVPGLHLRGYPSLLLYPSGKKSQPFVHSGGLDSGEAIIDWLSEKVTHKFDKKKVLYAFHNLNDDDELPQLEEEL